MKRLSVLLIIGLSVWLLACNNTNSADNEASTSSPIKIHFDADSAYAFVAQQLHFGFRIPGTQAHRACGNYLQTKLQDFADTVYRQDFTAQIWDGSSKPGTNLVGVFNPQAEKRIVLAAHWDSRPYADQDPDPKNHSKPIPGANDGASGVGVLLEIARQLKSLNLSIGVDIVLFDIEDYGTPSFVGNDNPDTWCLGAQYWSETPHIPNYHAYYGILLDMVGAANPQFTQEGTSIYYAADLLNKVWKQAQNLGYNAFFLDTQTGPLIDDHLYVNKIAKIPMIDIIHYDAQTASHFYPYWHTINDDLSQIDKNTLNIVGRTVLSLIITE